VDDKGADARQFFAVGCDWGQNGKRSLIVSRIRRSAINKSWTESISHL